MAGPNSTRWSVIQDAAAGEPEAREEFARIYAPVVRAYLARRWGGSPLVAELEDAVQEIFVDCFRGGGVLDRADLTRGEGFRAYLFGVVRIGALRVESRRARQRERVFATTDGDELEIARREATLSCLFDREWARAILDEAARLQATRAEEAGAAAQKRVELLRCRFQDGLPIREIARVWGVDASDLHREYSKAREEFRTALFDVVSAHHGGTRGEIERECVRLVQFLK